MDWRMRGKIESPTSVSWREIERFLHLVSHNVLLSLSFHDAIKRKKCCVVYQRWLMSLTDMRDSPLSCCHYHDHPLLIILITIIFLSVQLYRVNRQHSYRYNTRQLMKNTTFILVYHAKKQKQSHTQSHASLSQLHSWKRFSPHVLPKP